MDVWWEMNIQHTAPHSILRAENLSPGQLSLSFSLGGEVGSLLLVTLLSHETSWGRQQNFRNPDFFLS